MEARHPRVLAYCESDAIGIERQNAVNLLQSLLSRDPATRSDIQQVLDHPFWRDGESTAALPIGQHRASVLKEALTCLEHHVAEFCPTAIGSFLNACEAKVAADGCTWRDAVEALAAKSRKPKQERWELLAQSKRHAAQKCTVCAATVQLRRLEEGHSVELQLPPQGQWIKGRVAQRATKGKHCAYQVLAEEGNVLGKELTVKLKNIRECSDNPACDHREQGGTLVLEECDVHELCDIWDVVALFIPYGIKDLKRDFHQHDGTNLLNLLASVSQDPLVRQAAERTREKARNVSAHHSEIEDTSYTGAMESINGLAVLTGDTDTEAWTRVQALHHAVICRAEGAATVAAPVVPTLLQQNHTASTGRRTRVAMQEAQVKEIVQQELRATK